VQPPLERELGGRHGERREASSEYQMWPEDAVLVGEHGGVARSPPSCSTAPREDLRLAAGQHVHGGQHYRHFLRRVEHGLGEALVVKRPIGELGELEVVGDHARARSPAGGSISRAW
jgi:hypothetical protein